jgi:MoaA/NifB/PqqE/SkfB family radical SAM enzyme
MPNESLKRMLANADMSNYPNHITLPGEHAAPPPPEGAYADYRRRWVERARTLDPGDFPLHLDVEVTNTCNLRCKMCFVDFSADTGKFIDFKLFRKIMDQGAEHGLRSVKFNYRGEPTLHRNLPEMVAYAKRSGVVEAMFNTNATRLTRELSERLVAAGLDKIIISLDGITPGTYNRLRVGADYHKVVANILGLLEVRKSLGSATPTVRVQMVCMQENRGEIAGFIGLWKSRADQVGLIRYRRQREDQGGEGIADYQEFARPCHQIFQRMVVGCDGIATMCCGDVRRQIVLGDVRQTPLAELWKSVILEQVRERHRCGEYGKVPPCVGCGINRHNRGEEWDWLWGEEGAPEFVLAGRRA